MLNELLMSRVTKSITWPWLEQGLSRRCAGTFTLLMSRLVILEFRSRSNFKQRLALFPSLVRARTQKTLNACICTYFRPISPIQPH